VEGAYDGEEGGGVPVNTTDRRNGVSGIKISGGVDGRFKGFDDGLIDGDAGCSSDLFH
jgi:hypothetical protein